MTSRHLAISTLIVAMLVGAGCGDDADVELRGEGAQREAARTSNPGNGGNAGPAEERQSTRTPRQRYIADAERICRKHEDKVAKRTRELQAAREASDAASFIGAYRRAVGALESLIDDLAALPRPPGRREKLERAYGRGRKAIEKYDAGGQALEGGDLAGAITLAQKAQKATAEWTGSLRKLGIGTCADTGAGFATPG